jgi:hypothetical protein
MASRADQRKFHYIYKITRNDGSGKYYIGMHSTDDLEDGYFGSGKMLWHSINRHGKDIHSKEILEHLPTREALKLRERELVNEEIVNDPKCMNLRMGGEGWGSEEASKAAGLGNKSPKKNYTEIRRKAAITRRERGNHNTHRTDNFRGKKHTEKTRQQMSASHQGKHDGEKNSQFGTCWVIKDGAAKKIHKEQLDEHLSNGYRTGRK